MNDGIRDGIKEVEENGQKYTIQYLKGGKLDKNIPTKKVIIVGLSGVGKTTISFRLITNEFKICSPTISLDLACYKMKINDEIIQMQLWDSCGNDDFAANTPNLFKSTFIGILVYEIDKMDSFREIEKWYNLLKENSIFSFVYLIGNKADLEEKRQVQTSEGEQLKNDYKFNFFMETSAKSGFNIENLLNKIGIDIYESNKKEEEIKKNNGRISLERENLDKPKKEEVQKKMKKKNCCQ